MAEEKLHHKENILAKSYNYLEAQIEVQEEEELGSILQKEQLKKPKTNVILT